jgi:hypothetical protein
MIPIENSVPIMHTTLLFDKSIGSKIPYNKIGIDLLCAFLVSG